MTHSPQKNKKWEKNATTIWSENTYTKVPILHFVGEPYPSQTFQHTHGYSHAYLIRNSPSLSPNVVIAFMFSEPPNESGRIWCKCMGLLYKNIQLFDWGAKMEMWPQNGIQKKPLPLWLVGMLLLPMQQLLRRSLLCLCFASPQIDMYTTNQNNMAADCRLISSAQSNSPTTKAVVCFPLFSVGWCYSRILMNGCSYFMVKYYLYRRYEKLCIQRVQNNVAVGSDWILGECYSWGCGVRRRWVFRNSSNKTTKSTKTLNYGTINIRRLGNAKALNSYMYWILSWY